MKLREEKHHGFIEVFTRDHQPMGVLFLQEGEPIEMFTTSASDSSVFGRKSIPTFVENAVKTGAIFNVYRTLGKISKEEKKVTGGVEDLKELTLIFQEVLSKVENLVDGISQKGKFLGAFKKSLLEESDKYPFLDPFSSEFEYREGTVQFTGDAVDKDLAQGILECLRATLSQLAKELPQNKIFPLKLRAEIESSLKPYQETVKRLGIDAALSSFFK
jgi:hypothetical protein